MPVIDSIAKAIPLNRRKAEEMRAEAEAYFEDAKNTMQLRLPRLIEQMAFFRGLQWGVATEFGWIPDDHDAEEAREVYNYVRPTVRTAVANKLKHAPNPEAVAGNDDQRALARAYHSTRLLRSFLRNGVFRLDELYRGTLGSEVYGGAWFKAYFNPNSVFSPFREVPVTRPSASDPTGLEPVLDDFGQPKMDLRREGEIQVDYVDVVDALPDPHARKPTEIRHIFHRKLIPVSTLNDLFPEDWEGKKTADRWSIFGRDQGYRERDYVENDTRAYGGILGGHSLRASGNSVGELVEFWERPTNQFPRGRLIVFSAGVIVAIGPLPQEWPWHLLLGENVIPSALYPDGVIRDCLSMQRSINLNASKRREWLDKAGQAWLLVPRGSKIDRSRFSDMSGEIIDYAEGAKPDWMAPPPPPPSMFQMENQLVQVLKDVTMHSDIARGEPPQGIETGRALAYLYEFQQGATEPDSNLFKQTIVDVLKTCLKLARDFYEEGRLVTLVGENNRWSVKAFKAADYDFDAEVIVEPFSGAPNSRALRFAEAMEMFEKGALNDTPQAAQLRRLLDYDFEGGSTSSDKTVAEHQARAENMALLEDPFAKLEVKEYEDHHTHLDEHNRFRNSQEYDDLPFFAQQEMDRHVAEHELTLDDQERAMAGPPPALSGPGQGPEPPGSPSPLDGGAPTYPNGTPDETRGPPPPEGPGSLPPAGIEKQLRAAPGAPPPP